MTRSGELRTEESSELGEHDGCGAGETTHGILFAAVRPNELRPNDRRPRARPNGNQPV